MRKRNLIIVLVAGALLLIQASIAFAGGGGAKTEGESLAKMENEQREAVTSVAVDLETGEELPVVHILPADEEAYYSEKRLEIEENGGHEDLILHSEYLTLDEFYSAVVETYRADADILPYADREQYEHHHAWAFEKYAKHFALSVEDEAEKEKLGAIAEVCKEIQEEFDPENRADLIGELNKLAE